MNSPFKQVSRMPIRRAGFRFLLILGVMCAPLAVPAQTYSVVNSTVLTIDQGILFQSTQFGKRVTNELETERQRLLEIKRQIETDLAAEERDLTEKRKTLPSDKFRSLAEAFDEKVQAIRAAQDQKTSEFNQNFERERAKFLRLIIPVLGSLMNDRGAVIVLNRRDVLISANSIDITEESIKRIDAAIGDGTNVPQTGDAESAPQQ